jgi:hypothetical protein
LVDENILHGRARVSLIELIQRPVTGDFRSRLQGVVGRVNRTVLAANEAQAIAMTGWMIIGPGGKSVDEGQRGVKGNYRRPAAIQRGEGRAGVRRVQEPAVRFVFGPVFG